MSTTLEMTDRARPVIFSRRANLLERPPAAIRVRRPTSADINALDAATSKVDETSRRLTASLAQQWDIAAAIAANPALGAIVDYIDRRTS